MALGLNCAGPLGRRRTLPGRHGRAWLITALLAVAMRVLIPAGFMASPTAAAPFAVVICTGQGALVVDAPDSGRTDAPGKSAPHHSPCAFAGAQAAVEPPIVLVSPVAFTPMAAGVVLPRHALRPGQGLAAPPPPQTGPPVLTL